MKVVHIITGLGDGGAEHILFKVCKYDIANKHIVISLTGPGKYFSLLNKLGIKVYLGQRNKNLEGAWGIVVSTAIKPDNPEVVAAKAMKMPLIKRSEMLAELMRLKWCVSVAGTHGKTTTTTMVSAVLDEANYDPTVINGGIINAYGTNARLGEGDWMVVEADESDGTFIKIPSTVAVVTNIDPEHLDFYGDFENAKTAFEMFIKNVPFYGFSVMCIDHPEVQALIGKVIDRRIITYGFSVQAEVRGTNILFDEGSAHFDVEISNGNDGDLSFLRNIVMPMPGRHNISNALAAIAVSYELGISADIIRRTFSKFSGVKRRFTIVDKVEDIIIIDDYAHHPVEITSVLSAAREAYSGRVIAVVQPHRYTRLESLFDEFCSCFNNADTVIVAPVFDAGEQPIKGANQDDLISGLQRSGHREVIKINEPKELPKIISNIAVAGDLVIYLGAGSISSWAYLLPDALRRLKTQ